MKNLFVTLIVIFILAIMPSCQGKSQVKNNNVQLKKEKVMSVIHLTKKDFLEKVANYETNPNEWKYLGDKPCVIDFYATWCGPCKMMSPIMAKLAEEYKGQIYVYEIDTEQEQELAGLFGIQSIPTFLFVPMNGKPQMAQGAMPESSMKDSIQKILLQK